MSKHIFYGGVFSDIPLLNEFLADPGFDPNQSIGDLGILHYACHHKQPEAVSAILRCPRLDLSLLPHRGVLDIFLHFRIPVFELLEHPTFPAEYELAPSQAPVAADLCDILIHPSFRGKDHPSRITLWLAGPYGAETLINRRLFRLLLLTGYHPDEKQITIPWQIRELSAFHADPLAYLALADHEKEAHTMRKTSDLFALAIFFSDGLLRIRDDPPPSPDDGDTETTSRGKIKRS